MTTKDNTPEVPKILPASELDDVNLIQNLIELYVRSGAYPDSRPLHERWVELKTESDNRFVSLRQQVKTLEEERDEARDVATRQANKVLELSKVYQSALSRTTAAEASTAKLRDQLQANLDLLNDFIANGVRHSKMYSARENTKIALVSTTAPAVDYKPLPETVETFYNWREHSTPEERGETAVAPVGEEMECPICHAKGPRNLTKGGIRIPICEHDQGGDEICAMKPHQQVNAPVETQSASIMDASSNPAASKSDPSTLAGEKGIDMAEQHKNAAHILAERCKKLKVDLQRVEGEKQQEKEHHEYYRAKVSEYMGANEEQHVKIQSLTAQLAQEQLAYNVLKAVSDDFHRLYNESKEQLAATAKERDLLREQLEAELKARRDNDNE